MEGDHGVGGELEILAASVLEQVGAELVDQLLLDAVVAGAVLRGEPHGVLVGGVHARHGGGAVLVHLARQLAGEFHRAHLGAEEAPEGALHEGGEGGLEALEGIHGMPDHWGGADSANASRHSSLYGPRQNICRPGCSRFAASAPPAMLGVPPARLRSRASRPSHGSTTPRPPLERGPTALTTRPHRPAQRSCGDREQCPSETLRMTPCGEKRRAGQGRPRRALRCPPTATSATAHRIAASASSIAGARAPPTEAARRRAPSRTAPSSNATLSRC